MIDVSGSKSDRIAYTPTEAAAVTGRTRTRIFKAIKDGELTARKDGRATLIEDTELLRWVKSLPTIGRQLNQAESDDACRNPEHPRNDNRFGP